MVKNCKRENLRTTKYPSTLRYLSWLLEDIWRQNGYTRPSDAGLEEDIQCVANFEKNYSRVRFFCPEVEQSLLGLYFEERLKARYVRINSIMSNLEKKTAEQVTLYANLLINYSSPKGSMHD